MIRREIVHFFQARSMLIPIEGGAAKSFRMQEA